MAGVAFENVPFFSGETDVNIFLQSYELEAVKKDWTDAKKCKVICYCLTGVAKQAFDSMSAEDAKDFTKISKKLREACCKPRDLCIRDFQARILKPGETPTCFALDLERLIKQAYPDLTEDGRLSTLQNQFLKCLPSQVRAVVRGAMSKLKWSEVVALAEEIYQDYTSEGSLMVEPKVEIDGELNRMRVKAKERRPKFNGNCNFCGRFGHKEVQCFKKSKNRSSHDSFFRKANGNRRTDERTQSNNNQRYSANVNNINLNERDDFTDVELENFNMLELKTSSIEKRTNLIRVNGLVKLTGTQNGCAVKMLVDGGASHSFLNMSVLPDPVVKMIEAGANGNIVKREYHLQMATETKLITCYLGKFLVKINDWIGEQTFVVSRDVYSEQCILGRDFLKDNKVLVDHSSDQIQIRSQSLVQKANVNKIECVVSKTVEVEPLTERLVYAKIGKLEVNRLMLFEPNYDFESKGLKFASSLHKVEENMDKIVVSVLNSTTEKLRIEQGECVGSLEPPDKLLGRVNEESIEVNKMNIESQQSQSVFDPKKLNVGKKLNSSQRKSLLKLLKRYESVFKWGQERGLTNQVRHKIVTTKSTPIKAKQYRLSPQAKQEVRNQVKQMLKEGIIEESESPWCSPVVLVAKKTSDGSLKFRFCIDFTKLNEITVKDSYPLPRIDETLEALAGSNWFTTLDADSGYWQVELSEDDREKTAFACDDGLYHFKVMPFGLCNGPATFQRLMNKVLRGMTWSRCMVYIDDIIIFSTTFNQHLARLEMVLERLKKANIKLNPSKCHFLQDSIIYLGHRVSGKGIQPDEAKIKCVREMKPPKTAKELKRFLGVVSYYRKFIRRFSHIASRLYKMSESKHKFKWDEAAEKIFNELKQKLLSAPVLVLPDFRKPFRIECDASDVAIGAVLIQTINNKDHPVAYASRHLTKTERRYTVTEKELLSIVWAARHFRPYVLGRPIVFITDHKPLATLKKIKDPAGRIGRMFSRLQDLDFDIVYKSGVTNVLPDFLSRLSSQINLIKLNDGVNWILEQDKDLTIKRLKELLKLKGSRSDWLILKNSSEWMKIKSYLKVLNGILVVPNHRVVVPEHAYQYVLRTYHDYDLSGHRSFETTYLAIQAKFFWIGMRGMIKSYCETCDLCQRFKPGSPLLKVPLKQLIVNRPWQLIGIDFMGPLVQTKRGNMYIILAIDYFSKLAEGMALTTCDALVTAKFIFEEIVCRYGLFEALLSDQGRNFESLILKQLCQTYGITKHRTSAYHPECNGLVERTNRTIKQILKIYVHDTQFDWDLHLKQVISSYNFSCHTSTGFSPYEIVFGSKPFKVMDSLAGCINPSTQKVQAKDYVSALRNKTDEIHRLVNTNLEKARTRQKAYYDQRTKPTSGLKVNDLIMLKNFKNKVGLSKCFESKFIGPFIVTRLINEVSIQVRALDRSKTFVVHANRIKKYKQRTQPKKPTQADIQRFLFTDRDDGERVVAMGEERVNEVGISGEDKNQKTSESGEVARPVNNDDEPRSPSDSQETSKTPEPTRTRSGRVVKPVDRLIYFS